MFDASPPSPNSVVAITAPESTRKGRSSKPDVSMPSVAWPTVWLLFGCTTLWTASLVLSVRHIIPIEMGMALSALCAFAGFTPMHDSAHRTVSRVKWVNEAVGRIGTLLLMIPFPSFRFIHLEHHRNTNDTLKDPDYWSGTGPTWTLPLRWLTQDVHYFSFYLRHAHHRPWSERWESCLTLGLIWAVVVGLCLMGFARPVLLLWVLPTRIAGLALAYSFDYLPHKPHTVPAAENKYQATLVRSSALLTPILLYQNYHLIHHLYPGVPFYRYARIWRAQKADLIAKGVEVRDLFGRTTACSESRL